jgi:ABC-type transport system substrate-binding protein
MAFLKKKSTMILVAVLLVVVVGAYAYIASQPTPEEILRKQSQAELEARRIEFRRTMTWVQPRSPTTPGFVHFGADNKVVGYKEVYESLLRYEGSSLDLKPSLAEKWEQSADGKVFTFYLRKGVKFYPSGDPFNAAAVKYSLDNSLQGTNFVSLYGPDSYHQYDRTEIVDDYTVKVHFKERPVAWFKYAFANPAAAILNPKFINAHGGMPKDAARSEVDPYLRSNVDTTGPYVIDENVPGDRVVLKRNPTYWGGWGGNRALAPERVVMRVVPEASTRMMLIARGDADITFVDVPYLPELKRRIQSEKLPLIIDEAPSLRIQPILLDHLHPPTSDVHIRRMLAYSFNYDRYISDIVYGFADRMTTFTPKGMNGYMPDVPYYTFDLTKAKQELELAASENRDMVAKEIRVTYSPEGAGTIGTSGYLMWKSDLAKIGVNLVLTEVPYARYRDIARGGGATILDRWWMPDYPDPATYYAFVDPGYYTSVKYGTTPAFVGDLLKQAAFEPDWNKRLDLYRKVEEWAFESVPYIKVASGKGGQDYNVRGDWVKGWESHVDIVNKMVYYWLWKELPEGRTTSSSVLLLVDKRNICNLLSSH